MYNFHLTVGLTRFKGNLRFPSDRKICRVNYNRFKCFCQVFLVEDVLYVAQNAELPRHFADDCFFAFPVVDKRTVAKHHNNSSPFSHETNGSETPFRGDVQSSISDSISACTHYIRCWHYCQVIYEKSRAFTRLILLRLIGFPALNVPGCIVKSDINDPPEKREDQGCFRQFKSARRQAHSIHPPIWERRTAGAIGFIYPKLIIHQR